MTRARDQSPASRIVKPSSYFLLIFIAALVSLVLGLRILHAAFQVDAATTFGQITLVRMQQSLALACALSLICSALVLRATAQIRGGTKRYREFPPRRSTLLRPTAVLRGHSAERVGWALYVVGWALMGLSLGLVAGTLMLISF